MHGVAGAGRIAGKFDLSGRVFIGELWADILVGVVVTLSGRDMTRGDVGGVKKAGGWLGNVIAGRGRGEGMFCRQLIHELTGIRSGFG